MYSNTVPSSNTVTAGVTYPTQPSSSVYNPVPLLLRRSSHVLLDKRPSKKQRNALCVNSRHVGSHYPNLKGIQQSVSVPDVILQASQPDSSTEWNQLQQVLRASDEGTSTDMKANIPNSEVVKDTNNTMETDHFQPSDHDSSSLDEVRSSTSISSKADVSTHLNDDIFTQSFDTMVAICDNASNQVKEESPPLQAVQATLYSTTTHNLPINSPMSIKHKTHGQAESANSKVQSWKKALKHIQKQLQNYELFGDKLVFTAELPDFLTLLKQIDQRKNWVTYQEEQATNLAYYIKEILGKNGRVINQESKRLAIQIADNFDQRFRNERYFGPTS